jgi:hypothetical protein
MFGQTSGVSSPTPTRGKNVHVSICLQTFGFRCTAPTSARSQLLSFLSVGHVKILVYSAATESEETLHHRHFYVCPTIHNPPGTFERVRHFGHLLRTVA